MSKRVTRWVGAALAMVIVSVGAIAAAAAADQAPVDRPQPLLIGASPRSRSWTPGSVIASSSGNTFLRTGAIGCGDSFLLP